VDTEPDVISVVWFLPWALELSGSR